MGKKCSAWMLLVGPVLKLFVQKIQTNSCYEFYAFLNVLFHMMTQGNHDLCSGVTELHGFCGW